MIRIAHKTSKAFESRKKQPRPPVILQIIPELNAGGAEQGCIDVTAAIAEAGGVAIVVSNGGARAHEIIRKGGTHIVLPVHSKNPFVMWRNIGRLRALIKEHNVDIVHVRSRAPAWSAWRAVRKTQAKFVTTCHSAYRITGKLKRFYNSIMARGERVIAVSHFIADYLERNYRINASRIRVIHRGIALEKYHPNSVTPERLIAVAKEWRVPDGASIIMLPGRITRSKGHHFLIDALALLRNKEFFCVFVGPDQGKGTYRKELEAYIEEKGLSSRLRIVSQCDDLPAAYMITTVIVAPSIEPEGFGRIPVEAQAMGRPCIATDHGGMRETILRDETGWLVPPGDVRALVEALEEAMALDVRHRAVLATRAMNHVATHFTREQMCAQTLDVYAELLGNTLSASASDQKKTENLNSPGYKQAAGF